MIQRNPVTAEEIDAVAVERKIERLEAELADVRVRTKQYLKELGL